jgi:hypothetical protein
VLKPHPLNPQAPNSALRMSQARSGEQLAMHISGHTSAPKPLFTKGLFTEPGGSDASASEASPTRDRSRRKPGVAPRRGSARQQGTAARRSGHGLGVLRRTSEGERPRDERVWDAVAAIRRAMTGAIEVVAIMFAFVVFGLGWAVLADASQTLPEQKPAPRSLTIASISSASVGGTGDETSQVATSAPSRYSSAALGAFKRQPNCQVEIHHASSQPSRQPSRQASGQPSGQRSSERQRKDQRLATGGCHE